MTNRNHQPAHTDSPLGASEHLSHFRAISVLSYPKPYPAAPPSVSAKRVSQLRSGTECNEMQHFSPENRPHTPFDRRLFTTDNLIGIPNQRTHTMQFDVDANLAATDRSVSWLERDGQPARAVTLSHAYDATASAGRTAAFYTGESA